MAKKKKKESGGLQVGGSINVRGGDFIAGDKVQVDRGVYVGGDARESTLIVGDDNEVREVEAARDALFAGLIKKINARPATPAKEKAELKENVKEIKAEAAKGEGADASFLSLRLRNIEAIAPDIAEVVLATLASPAAGFALVVKKVAERARKPAKA